MLNASNPISCAACTLLLAMSGVARAAESGALEEIVVTAQKRAESAQRVPIAISAFDARRLEDLGITSSVSLAAVTPGVTVDNIVGYAQFYIRGIGNDLTQGVDSSVALHLDGVYIPQLKEQIQDLVGLERVEVLRGPQGTLYGRNATGGAVNIITRSPDPDDCEVTVGGGFGDFNDARGTLYASTPFSDRVAGNIAASYRSHDAYNDNLTPDRELEDIEDTVLRGKLLATPIDNVELLFTAHYAEHDDADSMFTQQLQANAVGVVFGGRRTDEPNEGYNDIEPFSHSEFELYSLRIKAEFDLLDLVSISAYQQATLENHTDFDATDAFVFNFGVKSDQEAYSQELQFLSKPDSPIRWIAGLYYLDNEFEWNPVNQESPLIPGGSLQAITRDTTEAAAVFGEVTFPLAEHWSLTVGARYSHEKKEVPLALQSLPGIATFDFSGAKETWSKVTPKATLNYQFTPDMMFWLSAGRGFKSGGFNTSNPASLGPVDPEVVDAIEAGAKMEFADNRIRVNVSTFHYEAEDLQVQFIPASGTIVQNAASAKFWGGELEMLAQATDRLRLTANVSYLDGEYDDYPQAQAYGPAPVGNDSGVLLPADGLTTVRSPETTLNTSIEYVIPLPNGDSLALNGIYSWRDQYKFDPIGQTEQDSYGLVNASIAYITLGGKLKIALWGNNLGDEHYFSIKNINGLGTFATYAAPRTYGINFSYDFF